MNSPISDLEIKQKPLEPEDTAKKPEEPEVPKYYDEVDLTDEQEARLIKLLEDELTVIEQERAEFEIAGSGKKGAENIWGTLRNLYYGNPESNQDQQFNLHRFITKVKVDTCVRQTMKAFYESDPVFSVTP